MLHGILFFTRVVYSFSMNIIKSEYIISSPQVDKCPPATLPEYAFIGRSNVGKSSLINMICNNNKLAKTSAAPGKTQYINHFLIHSLTGNKQKQQKQQWYLVDLPGYGYAKTAQSNRKSWQKMISSYLRERQNLLNIFILIDSRHAPQKIDLEFVNQLGAWQLPFTLVFTKADKEKPGAVTRNVKAFTDELLKTWQFLPQQFITSAIDKTGRDEIWSFIENANAGASGT